MNIEKTPEISVVILCYRAGNFSRVFHKKVSEILLKENLDYEIILVGNYKPDSGDITPDVIKEISLVDSKTKCIAKAKTNSKQGLGWDLRSGLDITTGNFIAIIDGDGQVDPSSIPELLHKLKSENLDMTKCSRIYRGDGLYRKSISFLFNALGNLLFPNIGTNDINGKPKVFTRDLLKRLNLETNDWFIDAEMMIKARYLKAKIGEIDSIFSDNIECNSSITLRSNFEFTKNLLWWKIKEFLNK